MVGTRMALGSRQPSKWAFLWIKAPFHFVYKPSLHRNLSGSKSNEHIGISDKEEKETRINEPQMHTKLRHTQFSQFFERECMSCFKIASHLLIMLLCLGSSLSYEFCLPKVIRKFASPETSASEQRHDA